MPKPRNDMVTISLPELPDKHPHNPFFAGVTGYLNKRAVNRRLKLAKRVETVKFIRLMIRKVNSAIIECEKKRQFANFLVGDGNAAGPTSHREEFETLVSRYGNELASWLDEIYSCFPDCRPTVKEIREMILSKTSVSRVGASLVRALQHLSVENDPLSTWFSVDSIISGRALQRIQDFAAFVCSMIRYSFVVEPGRPRTDLRKFFVEFEILEDFLSNVALTPEEKSQIAFDANVLSKVREKKITCGDLNRVILKSANTGQERRGVDFSNNESLFGRDELFDGLESPPEVRTVAKCGTNDFIHANYVSGGPLINKFILTQAPLPNTVNDFWQLVWQDKVEYVFMLCSAVYTESLALLGSAKPNGCPQYWPKLGEICQYGQFIVENCGLNMTMDPLFQVTTLKITNSYDTTQSHTFHHWQWDWTEYDDFDWPLRLLRRSRMANSPTIIQCMDGCGRSGTLVLIEIMLMQLIRGSDSFANPMLTAAVFLRLQRRHAVSSDLQYLFAYRTVLHWCEPYVISLYHRAVLGFIIDKSGFCGKFAEIAATMTRPTRRTR